MVEGKKEEPKQQRGRKGAPSGATSIVRIAGRDVDGSLNIERSLGRVKGIGSNMAHALSFVIETKLGIPKATASGELSDEQISRIEAVVKDPVSNGIPQYMINRNKDMETGKSLHLVSNDLIFNTRQDVSRDVANGTWRGFRHQYGQKVRGQHTRSTGRTGVTVGVTKKKEMKPGGPAAKAAGPAKKEEQAEKKAEKK